MFDIGWGELVLIGLVALIVVGPKELPTVLRTAGQWMGRVKRMASEFQGQFQEALREAEVTDLKQHAEDLTGELKSLADIDPMAGSDKPTDETGESDWDEPPFETPEHETPELAEQPTAESASETETSAAGGTEPAISEPVAAEAAVAEETTKEHAADIEPAPAAPVAAVESAPVEAAESAPPAETPPPKQAGGTA
jgi:sec-independent protein translocase protein TatB